MSKIKDLLQVHNIFHSAIDLDVGGEPVHRYCVGFTATPLITDSTKVVEAKEFSFVLSDADVFKLREFLNQMDVAAPKSNTPPTKQ